MRGHSQQRSRSRARRWITAAALPVVALTASVVGVVHAGADTDFEGGFNRQGNVLIADQFNNRAETIDNRYGVDATRMAATSSWVEPITGAPPATPCRRRPGRW